MLYYNLQVFLCIEIAVEKHFNTRNVTSGGPRGLKKFSRLAIARHILGPPHKLCCNSTTACKLMRESHASVLGGGAQHSAVTLARYSYVHCLTYTIQIRHCNPRGRRISGEQATLLNLRAEMHHWHRSQSFLCVTQTTKYYGKKQINLERWPNKPMGKFLQLGFTTTWTSKQSPWGAKKFFDPVHTGCPRGMLMRDLFVTLQ